MFVEEISELCAEFVQMNYACYKDLGGKCCNCTEA